MKPSLTISHRRFLSLLAGVYGVFWIVLAIHPRHPADWWMENVLVFFTIGFLLITSRWFLFSKLSYLLAFLFTCLHTVGAHYTYSEVPYAEWFPSLFGEPGEGGDGGEGEHRNHYDRVVHFLYGVLITWPYREAFYYAMIPRRTYWSYLVPLVFSMATSLLYELLEWGAAILYGGEQGMAFLGTQGDIWDAHKDMLLAAYGSLLCFGIMLVIQWSTGRDFAREWGEGQRNRKR